MTISLGLCQCGCGLPTRIANKTDARYGHRKGEYRRFARGHGRQFSHRWINDEGYVLVWAPGHPRAHSDGYVFEHILVVEAAIGHFLPITAKVHHWNEVRHDNRPRNLVVLENDAEHASLHQRRRVQLAGGDPHTQLLCCRCHRPKDKTEFYVAQRGGFSGDCKSCSREATFRRNHPRSTYRPRQFLAPEIVRSIRAAVGAGDRQADVARRFSVSRPAVNDIIKGRKWRSVA